MKVPDVPRRKTGYPGGRSSECPCFSEAVSTLNVGERCGVKCTATPRLYDDEVDNGILMALAKLSHIW